MMLFNSWGYGKCGGNLACIGQMNPVLYAKIK